MIRNHVWFVTAISYISILFVVHILEKKTLFNYHRIDPFSSNFNFHLNTSHHFASVKSPFIRIHQRCIPTHLRNHRIVINPSQRKKKKLDNPSKATIHHADQRTTNSSIQNRSIRSFRSPSDALANLPVFRWNGRGAVVLLLSAITRCPQTDREREREISQAVGH